MFLGVGRGLTDGVEDDTGFHDDDAEFIVWVCEAVVVVAQAGNGRASTGFVAVGVIGPLIGGAGGFDGVVLAGVGDEGVSGVDESVAEVFD